MNVGPGLAEVLNDRSLLPAGFHLAAPGADGQIKMWLKGDPFFDDLWDFFKKFREVFCDPNMHICCLKRGAGSHVTVIGNGAGRKDIQTIQAISRKEDGTTFDEVIFPKPWPPGLESSDGGRNWVFVDDLSDEGKTYRAVKELWPNALFLTVYEKPRGESFNDGFFKSIPDVWVVFPGEQPWEEFVAYEDVQREALLTA